MQWFPRHALAADALYESPLPLALPQTIISPNTMPDNDQPFASSSQTNKKKRAQDHSLTPDAGTKPIQLQRRRVWRACENCRCVPPVFMDPASSKDSLQSKENKMRWIRTGLLPVLS